MAGEFTYQNDKGLAYPLTKMNFKVSVAEVDGTAAFSQVTGIEASVDVIEFRPHRETGMARHVLVGGQLREADQPGCGFEIIACRALAEGLDPADQERGRLRFGIDDPDPSAVHGLDISLLGQHGDGAPDRVAGTVKPDDQLIL